MLFSSYQFILLFLPISLVIYYQVGIRSERQVAKWWLIISSLIFYGWLNPIYLAFLIPSGLINYGLGLAILRQPIAWLKSKSILSFGVIFNLSLLGYFKYYNFFLESLNSTLGTSFTLTKLIVPLGISFITFEQIAYLVDTAKGKNQSQNLLDYALFITFFPKLISGPIIRYKELIPQFSQKYSILFNSENLSVGITIFAFGMFKKLVIADRLAPYTTMFYATAENGVHLTLFEAWLGVLAHYLQLYFDFSGYSDMAIGVARMFGIKLPLNFDSPYKALNINQFWSRWHISLTRFFRDYLYFPLAKKLRKKALNPEQQTIANNIITMTLTGIWHGAGWNYLIWGALQGFYLSCYQIWRNWRKNKGRKTNNNKWWHNLLAWSLTFFAWTFALVLAKTKTVTATILIWQGMLGFNSFSLPQSLSNKLAFLTKFGIEFRGWMPNLYIQASNIVFVILILLIIVWFAPSTQQWMGKYKPALDYFSVQQALGWQENFWQKIQWKPIAIWSFIVTLMTIAGVWSLSLAQSSQFIYFDY